MQNAVQRKKVIVAGHICLDITPLFPERNAALSEVLSPGKLIQVGEADVHTGGCVANTGLAMKILGADVSLMGKVGRDDFGEMVAGILKKYGAQSGLIAAEGESTSYSVILALPGIDRTFLHNPGANHSFCAKDIPWEQVRDAALFHFGYPPLMRSMYADNGAELAKILRLARACGAAVSMDMAAVDPKSEAGLADWDQILKNILPLVDLFAPSAEELCYMLDKERYLEWQERAGGGDITEMLDISRDVRPLAQKCMDYGAKVLLIKCGAPGMYYCTAGRETLEKISARCRLDADAWANREGFEKGYVPKRVASATGAGDVSIAAFLTAMLEESSLEDAMHLAAAAGAACVECYDALSGLEPLDVLREKIARGWKKYGED